MTVTGAEFTPEPIVINSGDGVFRVEITVSDGGDDIAYSGTGGARAALTTKTAASVLKTGTATGEPAGTNTILVRGIDTWAMPGTKTQTTRALLTAKVGINRATDVQQNLNFNYLPEDSDFYTGAGATDGVEDLFHNDTLIDFCIYRDGICTGGRCIAGQGRIAEIGPNATADNPEVASPMNIVLSSRPHNFLLT